MTKTFHAHSEKPVEFRRFYPIDIFSGAAWSITGWPLPLSIANPTQLRSRVFLLRSLRSGAATNGDGSPAFSWVHQSFSEDKFRKDRLLSGSRETKAVVSCSPVASAYAPSWNMLELKCANPHVSSARARIGEIDVKLKAGGSRLAHIATIIMSVVLAER